jgi:integrase
MLTKRDVDRLTFDRTGPATQIMYEEGGVPGFGVRVRPSGRRTFVVWYRTSTGRSRMFTLGTYGVLTVKQGREAAQEVLGDVRKGGDPLEARRRERDSVTVASFASRYLEQHAKPKKKTWREDRRRLETYVSPRIGHRKLAEVSRADVARLHNAIGREKPFEANRVLALVAVLFSKAQEWGYLPDAAPNPAKHVQRFAERSRERYVEPDEMPALAAAIDAETSPFIRAAFRLYLLTGLRRSELLSLRWKDVDLTGRKLRLSQTKAGRSHVVPLSEPALAILRELPHLLGNPFVLPGHKPGKPLTNVAKPWRRIRARMWLALNAVQARDLRLQAKADVTATKRDRKHASDREEIVEARLLALAEERVTKEDALRLHDLRRTVGSWLAMGGASLPLIGKVLNHSNASTTQIYARLAEDAPRVALEELGAKMVAAGVRVG